MGTLITSAMVQKDLPYLATLYFMEYHSMSDALMPRDLAVERNTLTHYIDQILNVSSIRDYCPNGLQVEGRSDVRHIVTGVTANQALIDEAIELGADTLLVHHGYFWKGEDERVVGIKRERL